MRKRHVEINGRHYYKAFSKQREKKQRRNQSSKKVELTRYEDEATTVILLTVSPETAFRSTRASSAEERCGGGAIGGWRSRRVASRVQCLTLHKRDSPVKKGEELSWEKYGMWRQEQKARAARLEKQLRARWELEELIDEQLEHYLAHYNRAMIPSRLKDVAQLLMPQWAPPHELASLAWFGDWRPFAILDLLRVLMKSASFAFTSSLSDSFGVERLLSDLIREIRIEEAVIDEEMTEIQATCVLHLPTHFQALMFRSIAFYPI